MDWQSSPCSNRILPLAHSSQSHGPRFPLRRHFPFLTANVETCHRRSHKLAIISSIRGGAGVRVFSFFFPWLANRFCSIPGPPHPLSQIFLPTLRQFFHSQRPPCLRESRRAFGWLFNRSVESLGNRAIDGEAGASKCLSTGAGDQAVLHEGKNLKLFAHLTAETVINGVLGPFKQLRVPSRTVIERDCRDSPKHIVRSGTVVQIRRQSLPLWIVAAFGPVCPNENPLDRTGEAVIASELKLLHQRRKRIMFDGRSQRNARVHRDVPNGPAKAEPIDQIYGHGLVDRIDGHDFVVNPRVVHVPIGETDLAGVDTKCHDRRVVYHASRVSDWPE